MVEVAKRVREVTAAQREQGPPNMSHAEREALVEQLAKDPAITGAVAECKSRKLSLEFVAHKIREHLRDSYPRLSGHDELMLTLDVVSRHAG